MLFVETCPPSALSIEKNSSCRDGHQIYIFPTILPESRQICWNKTESKLYNFFIINNLKNGMIIALDIAS